MIAEIYLLWVVPPWAEDWYTPPVPELHPKKEHGFSIYTSGFI